MLCLPTVLKSPVMLPVDFQMGTMGILPLQYRGQLASGHIRIHHFPDLAGKIEKTVTSWPYH